ncbi:ABC transporter ATP-binding protein [Pelomonas sp. CA6]|uniref:ABC transporter ATP-binding protein n=1 Tax=Pelomonas sp. CA6 TaxID=2907999 RepID=UPI001F4BE2C6|nr:ABC transporter ATP-binding protein [Pelomonas sp. CA6]MCH7344951.1 ABC transporter ATP-binding protein [Pelomonas sp. CA6]
MIELQDIHKAYQLDGQECPVLHGISLRVAAGEFVALTGSSGSGKSTLMNILGCLDTPTRGRYLLDGRDVSSLSEAALARERNLRIGFVFQSFYLLPRMPAWVTVAQPLIYRGCSPAKRREAALEALRRVGLEHRAEHKPNELSGGQRQRVAIARALVGAPRLLLADEPTGNLDSRTAQEVMALFHELHGGGLTVLLVTHEPSIAAQCRRIVRLHDGRIAEDSAATGGGAKPAEERRDERAEAGVLS